MMDVYRLSRSLTLFTKLSLQIHTSYHLFLYFFLHISPLKFQNIILNYFLNYNLGEK